jgi:transcriptional regulator with PAS, ATPase and Fis domain
MPILFETSDDYHVERTLELLTRAALKEANGSRYQACLLMGVSVRTLRNWINKYKLAKEFPPSFGKASHTSQK